MSLTEELLKKNSNMVKECAQKNDTSFTKHTSPALNDYYKFLKNPRNATIDPEHLYTFYLQAEEVKREIVEALLLSDADPEEVNEVFGITPKMYHAYKEVFFNVDNLVSKLDTVEYLENYPEGIGKALKIRAFNLGPEFIYFKYANIVPQNATQQKLVKKMFMGSAYKAMESNYATSSNAASSKAATTHASLMLKAYEVMKNIMDNEGGDGMENLTEIITAVENANDSEGAKSKGKKKPIAKENII